MQLEDSVRSDVARDYGEHPGPQPEETAREKLKRFKQCCLCVYEMRSTSFKRHQREVIFLMVATTLSCAQGIVVYLIPASIWLALSDCLHSSQPNTPVIISLTAIPEIHYGCAQSLPRT